MTYEYKIVPAPVRGIRAKGLKTAEDRFAHALEAAINALAADGWEYLRADTLPCEQREGLMSKTTVYHNTLVFRREKKADRAPAFTSSQPQVTAERVEKKLMLDRPDTPEPPQAPARPLAVDGDK